MPSKEAVNASAKSTKKGKLKNGDPNDVNPNNGSIFFQQDFFLQ